MTPSRGEAGDRETSRTWAHLSDVNGTRLPAARPEPGGGEIAVPKPAPYPEHSRLVPSQSNAFLRIDPSAG